MLLVICFLATLCIVCAFILTEDTIAYRNAAAKVDHTIKPGMTRSEVYERVREIGPYRVIPLTSRPCAPWLRTRSQVETLAVGGPFMHSIDRYMCFDESGILIEIYPADY